MYIVKTSRLTGKFPVRFKKAIPPKPKETVNDNVLTDVPETISGPAETRGSGMAKLAQKMAQTKIANTDNKLKKFISIKL